MVANTDPIFVDSANMVEVTFVNADSTTPKDLVAAAANDTKIMGIAVTSDDTGSRVMQLFVHDGTTAYLVSSTLVATLAGTDGVEPAVDLLNETDAPWVDADGEFFLPSTYKLQVAPTVAVTAAKTITVVCMAGDY